MNAWKKSIAVNIVIPYMKCFVNSMMSVDMNASAVLMMKKLVSVKVVTQNATTKVQRNVAKKSGVINVINVLVLILNAVSVTEVLI